MQQQVLTVLTRNEIAHTAKGPIFKFFDQMGVEYSTFVQNISESVVPLMGQPVTVTYDSRPSKDGRYENRYIEAVSPANGGAPAGQAPSFSPSFATPAPALPQTFTAMQAPAETYVPIHYQNPKHPDEQRAIRRSVALNAAVATIANSGITIKSPGEVLAIAEVWETWLAGGPDE